MALNINSERNYKFSKNNKILKVAKNRHGSKYINFKVHSNQGLLDKKKNAEI